MLITLIQDSSAFVVDKKNLQDVISVLYTKDTDPPEKLEYLLGVIEDSVSIALMLKKTNTTLEEFIACWTTMKIDGITLDKPMDGIPTEQAEHMWTGLENLAEEFKRLYPDDYQIVSDYADLAIVLEKVNGMTKGQLGDPT